MYISTLPERTSKNSNQGSAHTYKILKSAQVYGEWSKVAFWPQVYQRQGHIEISFILSTVSIIFNCSILPFQTVISWTDDLLCRKAKHLLPPPPSLSLSPSLSSSLPLLSPKNIRKVQFYIYNYTKVKLLQIIFNYS